ncbi:hypothetical protein LAZ67_18002150 [Cordylochernes scorpioides]|uniref:Uncharacterized protein n=1 Tax=Cordylochernes scorpioides TaxID=51811 RepID=A0ABY6LL62_9ARAC|nr:hypothetical protein LAZ67_18002150 [Cordylochernes scorpioides]
MNAPQHQPFKPTACIQWFLAMDIFFTGAASISLHPTREVMKSVEIFQKGTLSWSVPNNYWVVKKIRLVFASLCFITFFVDDDFDDEEDLKTWLNNFFDTRPGDFWRNGINKLLERWEAVINNNREYIID